tara:strand:+ start:2102 stop:2785 length:684 start_codon:yes stop_codon:yes gene_type:complete
MVQGADAWTWGLCACTVRYHYDQKTKAANAVMAHSQITSEEQHQRVNGLKRWGTDAQWETMQAAKAWAVQFVKALEKGTIPKWGLLIGVPGCGKTHLLNGITNVLMDMGVQVVSTYVTAMLGELKKMYNGGPNHGKDQEYIDAMGAVSVLIIDDLGAEQTTDWAKSILDDIINSRYKQAQSRPTVISTNLSPKGLEGTYPRIWSRMSDRAISQVHRITLDDYRQRVR